MCYYKGSVFFANEQNAAPENRRKSRYPNFPYGSDLDITTFTLGRKMFHLLWFCTRDYNLLAVHKSNQKEVIHARCIEFE